MSDFFHDGEIQLPAVSTARRPIQSAASLAFIWRSLFFVNFKLRILWQIITTFTFILNVEEFEIKCSQIYVVYWTYVLRMNKWSEITV